MKRRKGRGSFLLNDKDYISSFSFPRLLELPWWALTHTFCMCDVVLIISLKLSWTNLASFISKLPFTTHTTPYSTTLLQCHCIKHLIYQPCCEWGRVSFVLICELLSKKFNFKRSEWFPASSQDGQSLKTGRNPKIPGEDSKVLVLATLFPSSQISCVLVSVFPVSAQCPCLCTISCDFWHPRNRIYSFWSSTMSAVCLLCPVVDSTMTIYKFAHLSDSWWC